MALIIIIPHPPPRPPKVHSRSRATCVKPTMELGQYILWYLVFSIDKQRKTKTLKPSSLVPLANDLIHVITHIILQRNHAGSSVQTDLYSFIYILSHILYSITQMLCLT